MNAPVVAHRTALRILVFSIGAALLLVPDISLLTHGEAAQGQRQNQADRRTGHPKPGKPEASLPNLEEVRKEPPIQHEPAPPIPSTIRSLKNPLQPWNGRRVGDPGTHASFDQSGQSLNDNLAASSKERPKKRARNNRIRRAHTARRPPPPTLLDNQFVDSFFTWAVSRAPSGDESTYWYDQLRVAYGQGQTPLKLAAVELGKTLFESADYSARSRDNHWYVYDLYKSYLMRDPDASGWAYWESQVPSNGRENVRRGFEESGEFAGLLATIVPNGAATSNAASRISAQVDPRNQPGSGMLTRDADWSLPLLSLPGRSGLDLGLGLSYSSMVWTRSGPYIYFDEDNGFPSPGFRLGFPTVQRQVFDAQTAKNSYLLVTAAGRRVELRQVGSSNIYEAADSSYLQLTDDSPNLLVRSTDGTQLSFVEINNEYSCTEIKDRNGNYITVNHNGLGRITTISDTLGRVITFNYDSNENLLSISQNWNGTTHYWATFSWTTAAIQTSFSSQAVIATKNGTNLPVLDHVNLTADGSTFYFAYTNSVQVQSITRKSSDNVQRSQTAFTYDAPTNDVPRMTYSSQSAFDWTGINGVPATVTTGYSVGGDGACVLTAPDGTIYKEYYGTGWQKGLTTSSEIWSGGIKQKWTTTTWTQDNTSVSYETNPRVTETNTYDAGGNRRRTVVDYGQYAQYGLPYGVHEYAADGVTEIRQTFTDYNLSQVYLDRRIIGLVSYVHVSNVSQSQSKISYSYDNPSQLQALPAAATQHDSSYSSSFTSRGNVTSVSRWDVTDINNAAKALTTQMTYNEAGAVVSAADPLAHTNSVSYADSFSDSVNRNTFAYPTTATDADGFSSTVQYNFDFGATTRTQGPPPAGQSQGAIQTMSYHSNSVKLERVTTTNTSAYTRYVYGPYYRQSFATVNNVADEAYSIQTFDGLGRVIGEASNNPNSGGGYSAHLTVYDKMGLATMSSNPTEINSSWSPYGDDATGWLYTQQTYDWKGRPLRTTDPDPNGTYKEASYNVCGCAGSEVTTLTDEGTIAGGVPKRRQKKIYSDVLGRTVKTELLNWQGGSVYSTIVNTYNVLHQITQIRQYAGPEGSSTYQDTTLSYDGYGRLKTKHVPDQDANKFTTWNYNADDTVQNVTDARGATTTLTYNDNRHLVTNIAWSIPAPSPTPVPTPASVSYVYDGVGNRTSMTDGFGNVSYEYDQLSRMKSETRTLTGVPNPNSADGKFKLSYDYNLIGQLKKLTDATNMTINYGFDAIGRLNGVTGSDNLYANVSTYASNLQYRAWGGLKSMTDGKGNTRSLTYNSRTMPTHFEVSGNIVSQNYDYYDDGALSFVHNQSDNNFDRSYRYDHASRLAEVKTGGMARNGAGDTPFYESFGYDVFDNSTARQTNTWNDQTMDSDSASYSNNRRIESGWYFDEDGRNLAIGARTNQYDASGRQIQTNTHRVVLGHNINLTTNFGYDGIGARISEGFSTAITYYLRSSVLGGAVVEELNGSGQKQTGYVYNPLKELLATQTQGSTNIVTWRHVTSFETGEYSINTGDSTVGRVELDPLYADVGSTEPPSPPPLAGDGEASPNHSGGGSLDSRFTDIFNTSDGCMIDGIPATCSMAMRLINNGAGAESMKALVYNHKKGEEGITWYGDVYSEGVAGFAFIKFYDGRSLAEIQGGGSAPDTYAESLGDANGVSHVWIYAGASLASTSFGIDSNYIELQKSDDELAANTVANGVEAALQVLKNGCWTDQQWNQDVQAGSRYFANVSNPSAYTQNWSSSISVHDTGVRESPAILTHSYIITTANGRIDTTMTLVTNAVGAFNFVLKYYPGQGMAVTSNSASTPHALSVPGYVVGRDPDVNVRWARLFLNEAPQCQK